jgi:D-glycero-D-manno-heptose 1,7-bisphosphate phosphatase
MGSDAVRARSQRAIFLDRDGVLNHAIVKDGKPYPPARLADLKIVSDAPIVLNSMKEAGFLLVVVTNQPDVARGVTSRDTIEKIHSVLRAELPLDDIFVCFHDDSDDCGCRKPRPGLLYEAAEKYDIDLPASYLIGDRWRDVEAGATAGCATVLIDYGYLERGSPQSPNARVLSLREAAEWIFNQTGQPSGRQK